MMATNKGKKSERKGTARKGSRKTAKAAAKKPKAAATLKLSEPHGRTVMAVAANARPAETINPTELVDGSTAIPLPNPGTPISILSVGSETSLASTTANGSLQSGAIDNQDYRFV
jgi:hypothetical protein